MRGEKAVVGPEETRAAADPAGGGALPARGAALLFALAAGLYFFRLGAVPLLGPDEPRYARVAVEMHRSPDKVTPTLQGRPWLEKPVLYYWLAGAAYSAFGETETAARLPSALALPVLIAAGFVAVSGHRRRFLRRLLSPGGIVVLLLVAGPWYGSILRRQGRVFVDEFLLNHNVQRFTSEIHHHAGPLLYYLPVLLAGLIPWSGLLLPAFGRRRLWDSATDRFLLSWLAVPLLFFSLA